MALRVASVDWPRTVPGSAPHSVEESRANARLIAAAPDLLAVLKGGNWTYLGDEYVVCLRPELVDAAIAKAEGRKVEGRR
ncbi:hypothetical protein N182_18395 [Sinorhizobium sp. GL2]|nr:hypothetical protein N182_18395 [Sinorhizobium sp. GL2]